MVSDRRSVLSRALYAGTQVFFARRRHLALDTPEQCCGACLPTLTQRFGSMFMQIDGSTSSSPRPLTAVADQRHHLGGEALQPLNAVGDRLAAKVEDQLMHAGGRERMDVAGDVVGLAGEAAAGTVAIRDAGVVQWRLVGDGECG